jgi:hypothetical protein
MKSLRIVALAALVVLSAAQAHADSIPAGDPAIRAGGGGGSVPITSPIFGILTQTGASPTDGSPCFLIQGGVSTEAPGCFFSNDIKSGFTIDALVFVVTTKFSGSLTCALSTLLGGASTFTHCNAGGHVAAFYGGPGIPYGDDFSMGFRGFDLNTTFLGVAVLGGDDLSNGFRGLNADTTFHDTAAVPEPGTLALCVSGIGALLVRRRSRVR